MRPSVRTLLILPVATAAFVFGAGACVDLFHSTDFATLCDLDATACATDGGGGEEDGSEPEVDAGKPIDFCTNTSAQARELAERACALIGACLGGDEGNRYGQCLVDALSAFDCNFNPDLRPLGATAARWDCLAKATDCGAIEQCLFRGQKPPCKEFGGGGTYSQCADDGTTVVVCGGTTTPDALVPCPLGNQICTESDESTARCTGRRTDCGPSYSDGCRGTSLYQCGSSGGLDFDYGIDCAELGSGRCIDEKGSATCAPRDGAPICAEQQSTPTASCKGSAAELCVRGQRIRVDCGALGLPCQPDTSAVNVIDRGHFVCRLPADGGGECTFTQDRCADSKLESCRAGSIFSVDCAKVPGMKTCGVGASGWATCKP